MSSSTRSWSSPAASCGLSELWAERLDGYVLRPRVACSVARTATTAMKTAATKYHMV